MKIALMSFIVNLLSNKKHENILKVLILSKKCRLAPNTSSNYLIRHGYGAAGSINLWRQYVSLITKKRDKRGRWVKKLCDAIYWRPLSEHLVWASMVFVWTDHWSGQMDRQIDSCELGCNYAWKFRNWFRNLRHHFSDFMVLGLCN